MLNIMAVYGSPQRASPSSNDPRPTHTDVGIFFIDCEWYIIPMNVETASGRYQQPGMNATTTEFGAMWRMSVLYE